MHTGPTPATGPATLNAPAPATGPATLNGPASRNGPAQLSDEHARSTDRTATRHTPPDGPAPTGPGLLEPAHPVPPAARNGTDSPTAPAARANDPAIQLHAAPVTGELPMIAALGRDRLDSAPGAEPSFTPQPSMSPSQDAPATRGFRSARDFPAGTPIPPGAGIPPSSPLSSSAGTAGPAHAPARPANSPPASTPIPRQGPPPIPALPSPAPAAPLNSTAAPASGSSRQSRASRSSQSSRASGTTKPGSATTESPRRRRSAKRRMATERIFGELASLAAIPASAYSVGEEVDGAMCLLETADGFEVFTSSGGSRHEVRVFSDEESACFYLFGVLAADAVRTGVLVPGQTAREPVPARSRDPLIGLGEPLPLGHR